MVEIIGDEIAEEDERFNMTLSNSNPISIYAGASSGVILNDDGLLIYIPMQQK